VASILTPTDAALGLGIFTNRSVPGRIRRALNVESGLNDGMATPFVTLFLAVLVAQEGTGPESWVSESLTELGIAIVVALVVGVLSGRAMIAAHTRGWTSEISDRFAVLATALLAYSGSVILGGNGFVAAFVGGLAFGAASKGRLHSAVEFTEDLGFFASFVVWAIFGALLLAPQFDGSVSWTAIWYAILSLTPIRMLPVAASLIGTRLRPATVLFMGWFGPRGLASVVFTLIAFESLERGGLASAQLIEIATWTVFFSVVAHGLTARPLGSLYGRKVADEPVEQLGSGTDLGNALPRTLNRATDEIQGGKVER
jgi:sodium/hydrogen antiporter